MKIELTALCIMNSLISCASYRNIYNGSYLSGDLKNNEALIAVKSGTSFMVGSAKKIYKGLNWEFFNFCEL